ncbi:aspartyl-phosphate phosphatase Spo0E family protein [Paenibacillus sp. 481]|uniref:aspartyl-phosphate phosphatase Spo0E family protein n=1 Tax=Paenibacillus sp. 481 TaxID=2835869 RepID=UPI001E544749|nr:aspartyl-phosphate phosphatase Spo0E family protein [Paenibacillus sp. 481]UHA74989.1 aspartyl-phosphate phosphatase Spo0E family protein [Paenibacillus sp. 481]
MSLVQCSNEDMLLYKMNSLRKQLDRAVHEHQSLSDERVVQISQELDTYVLQFQKSVWSRITKREVLQ